MKLNHNTVLGLSLCITLVLVYWASKQDDDATDDLLASPSTERIAKESSAEIKSGKEVAIDWNLLQGRQFQQDSKNKPLFAAHAWYVPPPPKPLHTEIVPVQPIAPVIPFAYLGKMENGPNGTEFYLSKGNKLFTIKLGENLDANWRLVSEDANTLYINYVQLNQTQGLSKKLKPAINQTLANAN